MRKKIIMVLLAAIIFGRHQPASAAEIFGRISTNLGKPAAPADIPGGQTADSAPPAGRAGLLIPDSPAGKAGGSAPLAPDSGARLGVKVLGYEYWADGALVRAPDKKIYVLYGNYKKHILNLAELRKYQGREIISATEEALSGFKKRAHVPGELIRRKGAEKIYCVLAEGKKHILNLEELRAAYFGREIHNISAEEFALY